MERKDFTRVDLDIGEIIKENKYGLVDYNMDEKYQGIPVSDLTTALNNYDKDKTFNFETATILIEIPSNANAYLAGIPVGTAKRTLFTPIQFYKIEK